MKITGNISDSLQFPLKNWVKMIMLGIILIIPIVNFIGLGYYLRIIKSTLEDLDELPGFKNVIELFIDGLKVLIVCIIYTIVPLIFYGLSLIFTASTFPSSSTYFSYLPILTGISGIFFMLAAIFGVIISIFLFMGIANMVYHDCEIRAALKYHEILDRIKAIGWKSYILWWIVLMLIVTFAGVIICVVGGILLYFILGFIVFLLGYGYLAMFQARSVALTFKSCGE